NKQDTGKFIVIGGDKPGFTGISQHDRIDNNIFRNTLPRQVNESEPIRVGESKLSLYDSFPILEHDGFGRRARAPEVNANTRGRAKSTRRNRFGSAKASCRCTIRSRSLSIMRSTAPTRIPKLFLSRAAATSSVTIRSRNLWERYPCGMATARWCTGTNSSGT